MTAYVSASFKTQVEVLKRIPITAALGQSVFTSTHTTLYEWICAQVSMSILCLWTWCQFFPQDDHSSLSQLITECHDGLRQVLSKFGQICQILNLAMSVFLLQMDDEVLVQLLDTAGLLVGKY